MLKNVSKTCSNIDIRVFFKLFCGGRSGRYSGKINACILSCLSIYVAVTYVKYIGFTGAESAYNKLQSLRIRFSLFDIVASDNKIYRERTCVMPESLYYPVTEL